MHMTMNYVTYALVLMVGVITLSVRADTVTVYNTSLVNTMYVTNVIYTDNNHKSMRGNLKKVIRIPPGKSVSLSRPNWKMKEDRDIWFTAGDNPDTMAQALKSGDRGYMVFSANVGSDSELYLMGSSARTSRKAFENSQRTTWDAVQIATEAKTKEIEKIPAQEFIAAYWKPVQQKDYSFMFN